eukprot:TRINITY_DN10944_c1_g1_i2.p4 TRINITY_DN10944_c1_g1~~TRINITY_DN10944_c1_g1_i2.p4  ORF type:complete len:125 (-),score=0.46 TRINITY_DN10944_c1_g1_i2:446-820(-)
MYRLHGLYWSQYRSFSFKIEMKQTYCQQQFVVQICRVGCIGRFLYSMNVIVYMFSLCYNVIAYYIQMTTITIDRGYNIGLKVHKILLFREQMRVDDGYSWQFVRIDIQSLKEGRKERAMICVGS